MLWPILSNPKKYALFPEHRLWFVACLILVLGYSQELIAAERGNMEGKYKQAQAHYQQGKQKYIDKDYSAAITEFKAAAKLRTSPILDFNLARCYDQLGQTKDAIAYYQKYLKSAPTAANVAKVQHRIAELKKLSTEGSVTKEPYELIDELPGDKVVPESQPTNKPMGKDIKQPASAPSKQLKRPAWESDHSHEALSPQSWSGVPPISPLPYTPPIPYERGKFYQQGWFWAACVIGAAMTAFIVVTVTEGNDHVNSHHDALTVRF